MCYCTFSNEKLLQRYTKFLIYANLFVVFSKLACFEQVLQSLYGVLIVSVSVRWSLAGLWTKIHYNGT
jgi:hypothetical protein